MIEPLNRFFGVSTKISGGTEKSGGGDFFYFPNRKRPRMLCISSFVRQAVPDSWSGLAERMPRNFSSHWWFDQE